MFSLPLRPHEADDSVPLQQAAEELIAGGDLEAARSVLERLLAENPLDGRSRGLLGLCHFKLGQLDLATEIYGALVADNPTDPTLRVNLGLVSLKGGRLDDAIESLEAAVSLAPGHRKALNYLGLALAQRGDPAGARDAFLQAGATAMAEKMERQLAEASEGHVATAEGAATAGASSAFDAASVAGGRAQPSSDEGSIAGGSASSRLDDASFAGGSTSSAFVEASVADGSASLLSDEGAVAGGSAPSASAGAPASLVDGAPGPHGFSGGLAALLASGIAPPTAAADGGGRGPGVVRDSQRLASDPEEKSMVDAEDVDVDTAFSIYEEESPRPQSAAPGPVEQPRASRSQAAAEVFHFHGGGVRAARTPASVQTIDGLAATASLEWPEGTPYGVGAEAVSIHFPAEIHTRLDGLVAARGDTAWMPVFKRFRGKNTDRTFGTGPRQMWRASGAGQLLFSCQGAAGNRSFLPIWVESEAYLVEDRVFSFEDSFDFENGRLPGQARDLHLVRLQGAGQVLLVSERGVRAERLSGEDCLSLPVSGLIGWTGALAPRLVSAEEGPAIPWIELVGEGIVLLLD